MQNPNIVPASLNLIVLMTLTFRAAFWGGRFCRRSLVRTSMQTFLQASSCSVRAAWAALYARMPLSARLELPCLVRVMLARA
jgi:hypothetical protein